MVIGNDVRKNQQYYFSVPPLCKCQSTHMFYVYAAQFWGRIFYTETWCALNATIQWSVWNNWKWQNPSL